MEVGDSFTVPLEGVQSVRGMDAAASKLLTAIWGFNKRRGGGYKFVVRTLREEGVARCWRTE